MAYATYTTEALVCGSRNNNTSDKSFLLFTKDAGMVWATARSVREERSKQRFALQDFSFVRVSLVRGKSGWRIGSAQNEINVFAQATSRDARAAVVKVVKLLRKFVQGEESHPALYEDTDRLLKRVVDGQSTHLLSELYTLRLLHKLGYVADDPSFHDVLTEEGWIEKTKQLPVTATRAVENALSVSHL